LVRLLAVSSWRVRSLILCPSVLATLGKMPIQKRWTSLSSASPPEEYGIYEFGIRKDGGCVIIYIGRARQGTTTLASRFKVSFMTLSWT
jgi:hypothetical protein